jgi:hypothetical protein
VFYRNKMSNFHAPKPTNTEWLYKNTTPELPDDIKQIDLKDSNLDCDSLKNYKSIASYNWKPQSTIEKPVMLIPGKASLLVSNLSNQQLSKSKYEQMCDENRYFMSEYPIEPIFRAVLECSPSFDFKSVDFVTDRNNLRKLLDFIEGNRNEAFRIDFQMIGDTLVLVRNDENAKNFCDDYGKDFELKYTEATVDHGAYRQIVAYKLGTFQMVVRFEVDCVEELSENSTDTDELIASMAAFNLDNPKQFDKKSKLNFIKSGDFKKDLKQNLIEMTTKSVYQGKYEYPKSKWNQMFFSNTDYLLIGWHSRGMLQKIEKLPFDQVTRKCGRDANGIKSSMSRLNDLLNKLKSIAAKECEGAIIFHHEIDRNALKIFRVSNKNGCLPKELIDTIFK